MNRALLACLVCLLTSEVDLPSAKQPFSAYTQEIAGTTVAFIMTPIPGNSKIDSFWMEEHEVTYEEYILFQDETMDKAPIPDGITRPSPPYIDFTLGMGKTGGFPANSMSQYAAFMYCKWLHKKTGVFYRLPTAAEWEYACQAGATAAYPFGDNAADLSLYGWYSSNSDNRYHAVKQLKPNAWGLYDMLGNMAEWTQDARTLKGGSFRDDAENLRSAAHLPFDKKWNARDPQIPKSKWWNTDAPFIGFRIIRPVKQLDVAAAAAFYDQLLAIK
jgi:formylglycine-generating enzyme required for sulfatase activity